VTAAFAVMPLQCTMTTFICHMHVHIALPAKRSENIYRAEAAIAPGHSMQICSHCKPSFKLRCFPLGLVCHNLKTRFAHVKKVSTARWLCLALLSRLKNSLMIGVDRKSCNVNTIKSRNDGSAQETRRYASQSTKLGSISSSFLGTAINMNKCVCPGCSCPQKHSARCMALPVKLDKVGAPGRVLKLC